MVNGRWSMGKPPHPHTPIRPYRLLAIILSFPVFLLIARFFPFQKLPSICAFYNLTGYPCPTCGMTRSVISLTHLYFSRAVCFNPLGPVFLLLFAVFWAVAVYQEFTGKQMKIALWAGKHFNLLAIIGLLLLLTFGVARIIHITIG